MQMMYETIYKALVEVGLEEAYTPQDYLNFFCLGNREAPDGSPASAGGPHPPNSPQVAILPPLRLQLLFWMTTCNFEPVIIFCHLIFEFRQSSAFFMSIVASGCI